MSDSILVRVRLGHFDYARPAAQQTQVTVQIPEVARVSYLLDHRQHGVLREQPWPAVLEAAEREYVSRGVVSDSTSAAARKAVQAWLAVDEHHDALYEAWVADCARRDPVARRLLADLDLAKAETAALRDRVAKLEAELADAIGVSEALSQGLHDEMLAASALYAALTMPTTPDQRQAALDQFTAVAQRVGQKHAPSRPNAITGKTVPVQALRADHGSWEDPHDSPLHHRYAKGRDLPETGGVQ